MKKIDKTRSARYFLRGALGLAFVLTASAAHGKSSRDVISMSVRDASVANALRQVNTTVGENIVSYKSQEVAKESKRITAQMDEVTVLMAVNTIIDGTNLRAIDRQSDVLVVPVSVSAQAPQQPARQQIHNIGGTVVNEQGTPMMGVAVQVAGTGRGTSTDARGQFVLSGIQLPATMAFSFMGYQTNEVRVTTAQIMNVTLHPSTITLESAVVQTGYQRRDRNQAVGSYATIDERELEMAPVTSWDKALEGQVAGVNIRPVSGRPGETAKIQIRGINTMTGNTEPLYVLDGMPLQTGEAGALENGSPDLNDLMTNGIGNIPPENIKSITILKDATAASIYGARAANGVIVIETKMGQLGADYVSYSGKFGITMAPKNKLDFMNSSQKVDFESALYDDFRNDNGGRAMLTLFQRDNGMISPAETERQLSALRNTNTDWMDVLYDNAFTQSHNISLSGGTDKMQYFSSINYQNSQGTLMENHYQSGGMNLKLNRRVRDNILIKTNLYSTFKKNREGQAGVDPFTYATFANTYEKPYNDDGSYAGDMTWFNMKNNLTNATPGTSNFTQFNIVKELRENTVTNYYGNMRGQLGVEWLILPGLRYNFDGVIDYTFINNIDESRPGTYRAWANNWLNSQLNSTSSGFGIIPEQNRGFLDESSSRTFNYTVRNSLEYSKTIDKHFMQVFGAAEFGGAKYNGFNNYMPMYLYDYRVAGYPSWDLMDPTLYQMLSLAKLGGSQVSEDRSASFIGSAVYTYDDRYVANFNVRYDGVDILGTDNQFSPLWSAGVKWNAHNEKFLDGMSKNINRIALSLGYGYRGSINRSSYPFNVYTIGSGFYDNYSVASALRYGNPTIRWEKKREVNLGAELSFFGGRLNAEARYFNERVTDLLDQQALPISTGQASSFINAGILTNKGLEMSVRGDVVRNEDWLWQIGGNITTVKNHLVEAYNKYLPELPPRQTSTTPATSNVQDYAVNGWYGYKFSHVDPATGDLIVWAQKRTEHQDAASATAYNTYVDEQVNLSTITTAQLQQYSTYHLGQQDPKLYGGFNTRVAYKQFELRAMFSFAAGGKLLSFRDRDSGPSGGTNNDLTTSRTNRTTSAAHRWRQYGDITDVARFYDSARSYTGYLLSNELEDGSYLKCNELSLAWRAPAAVLHSTRFSSMRVALIANNLFTLTKYSGIDPEMYTPFGYPTTPSITLSLNIGF